MITMTIREFLKHDYGRDIYIDGLDDLGVGYEGPIGLKPEGEKQFAFLLDFKIEVEEGEDALNAWVVIPDVYDLEKMGDKVIRFFWYIAGNCLDEDWERWFYFPKVFEFPENKSKEDNTMIKLTDEQKKYADLVKKVGTPMVQEWGYGKAEYVVRLADNMPFVSVFHPNSAFAFCVCVDCDNGRGIITDLVKALNDRDYKIYRNPEIVEGGE